MFIRGLKRYPVRLSLALLLVFIICLSLLFFPTLKRTDFVYSLHMPLIWLPWYAPIGPALRTLYVTQIIGVYASMWPKNPSFQNFDIVSMAMLDGIIPLIIGIYLFKHYFFLVSSLPVRPKFISVILVGKKRNSKVKRGWYHTFFALGIILVLLHFTGINIAKPAFLRKDFVGVVGFICFLVALVSFTFSLIRRYIKPVFEKNKRSINWANRNQELKRRLLRTIFYSFPAVLVVYLALAERPLHYLWSYILSGAITTSLESQIWEPLVVLWFYLLFSVSVLIAYFETVKGFVPYMLSTRCSTAEDIDKK